VVVTDIDMPIMDGITMWEQMQSIVSPTCKVLFMTGGGKGILEKAQGLPGVVLIMPFSLAELRKRPARHEESSEEPQ